MSQPDPRQEEGTRVDADSAPEADDSPEERLRRAEAQAEEHRSLYLRAAAELDNYRKRAAREVDSARQFGAERLALSLLPALDGLELGLKAADSADLATLVEGQKATLRLITKALETSGVTEIDPLGQPFDPQLHEAMATQPDATATPDSVVTVVQKGYQLNGRLLRPARVIIARPADA